MVGAARLAAARLSVVIGAISQGFGGVYQDYLPFADYPRGYRIRPLPAELPVLTMAGAALGQATASTVAVAVPS